MKERNKRNAFAVKWAKDAKVREGKVQSMMALFPSLGRRATAVWDQPAFYGEFCDAFLENTGLDGGRHLFGALRVLTVALGLEIANPRVMTAEELPALRAIHEQLSGSERLFRRFAQASKEAEEGDPDTLIGTMLKAFRRQRLALPVGGRMFVPGGVTTGEDHSIVFVLDRTAETRWRMAVCNPGWGREYHACAPQPPKIRYKCTVLLPDLPEDRVHDDAFWLAILVYGVYPMGDNSPER